jgi:hypothetical protein
MEGVMQDLELSVFIFGRFQGIHIFLSGVSKVREW